MSNLNIREESERREAGHLSPRAALATNTRGRERDEKKCDIRTDFQRDRDRIIHSKSFRRLKHKTQVFIMPDGDHYRTRLTHTLEVAQIARTIARALELNEDLTEAIALGHDLGHTPFGHSGESVLNEICPYGFEHNKQSLRVVDVLENYGAGLNLTWEVRDGIVNHTGDGFASTLEGQIVRFADRIAYINHDIDDALRAGVLTIELLPRDCIDILGESHSRRINNMIVSTISASRGRDAISMESREYDAMMRLREFMFKNVYFNLEVKPNEGRVMDVLRVLYEYFVGNLETVPNYSEGIDADIAVCDYIAGMTDNFALHLYEQMLE